MRNRLKPMTAGRMLKEGFLDVMGISAYRLAKATKMTPIAVSKIISGELRITAEIAVKFSIVFGHSAQFWLNLQNKDDLRKARKVIDAKHLHIEPFH